MALLMPEVSIITPYRNGKGFLPDLVASVRRQTFRDWECLLVDDGSDDGGAELLERCVAGDRRFRFLALPPSVMHSHAQSLPARPRNHALAQAGGSLVAFHDCDDLWHPCKLDWQLAFHRDHHLDLSVTAYGRFRRPEEPLQAIRCPPRQLSLEQLRQANPIPMLSVLIGRECLDCGFPLMPHEDYLLWLNVFRERPDLRYGVLPFLLAFYRLHHANQSRHLTEVTFWTYRVFREHGLRRTAALRQLMRWGAWHAMLLMNERRQGGGAGPVWELLERAPLEVASLMLS